MKLELLLVLAVSALVPSLSESRIVSRCELRTKLGDVLPLHKRFQRHKDVILAGIICEVEKLSNLNSSLVIVEGVRQPKTTAKPATTTTTTPSATGATVGPAAGTTTRSPTVAVDATTAGGFNTSEPVPTNSSAPSGSFRRKRGASHKKHDSEETLNDVENKFDSEEMEEDNEHMSDNHGGKDESSEHMMLWSLGKYGVFQLTDSHFCDSGYRWSKNKCKTDCSAFTDDDITDDIHCLIKSDYWRHIMRDISRDCRHQVKTFFNGCS